MRSQRPAVLRVIALAALPLLALSLGVMWQEAADRERQVVESRVELARAAALVAESYVGGQLSTLRTVAVSPALAAAPANPDRASAVLGRVAAENPEWFGISVIGPDGIAIAATLPTSRGVDISDRDYFRQVLATGRPVVSSVISGRVSGVPTVILAIPLELESAGRGALIAALPTTGLDQALREALGAREVGIVLLDPEGRPIVHPDPERVRSLAALRGWEPADAALHGGSGSLVADLDGQQLLVAYAPVRSHRWSVLMLEPTSAAFFAARRDLVERAALLVLALATVAGLGWHFGGHLARVYNRAVEARAAAEAARAEAELARRRATWLAAAGEALAGSLDYETTLANVARSAVPTFADWCFVDLLEEDGRVRRVAVAHADPAQAATAEGLRAYPPDPNAPAGAGRVLRTGAPELTPELSDASPAYVIYDAEHHRLVRAMGPRSALRVALRGRDRTLGVLSFLQAESGRRFGPADRSLAEDLARRAALAIENARLYAEARAAVRARDEFLSIASHELRTPLTTIKGAAQLLLRAEERGRPDPDQLQRLLRRINQTSDHLAAMIADLLDVSRLRSGRLPLRPETVDLAALPRELLARYAEQLDGRHQLTLDLPAEPCPVWADPNRLEQVLANLVENAAKYSPDGAEIRVTVRASDDEARLDVRDGGIGIPPGEEEAIFQPFGRAGNATGQNLPGLGLGLYICRQIVEQHGGRIQASSDGADRGTTVSLWLPLARTPAGTARSND